MPVDSGAAGAQLEARQQKAASVAGWVGQWGIQGGGLLSARRMPGRWVRKFCLASSSAISAEVNRTKGWFSNSGQSRRLLGCLLSRPCSNGSWLYNAADSMSCTDLA